MKEKKFNKHFNLDALVLTSGRTITFISASIISAVINLLFIGKLSKDAALLMIGISITLELAKLLHVTTYNTLNELARKLTGFDEAKIKISKVAKRWFIGYLGYAVIAVIAAVFFSLMNLGKETTIIDDKIIMAELVMSQAVVSETDLKNIQENIDKKQTALTDPTEVKRILSEIETERFNIQNAYQNAPLDENGNKPNITSLLEWRRWVEFVNKVNNEYVGKKYFNPEPWKQLYKNGWGADEIKETINKTYTEQLESLQHTKDDKMKSYKKQLEKVLSLDDVDSALIDFNGSVLIQMELSKLNNSKVIEAGSQGAFVIMGKVIGIAPDAIRTFLILILSLLVELTIYQTAPKVKISRKMMFQFTQYLPVDFNINKFMDKVDKELVDYDIIKITSKDEKQIVKAEVEAEKAEKKAKAEEANVKVKRARKAKKSVEKEDITSTDVVAPIVLTQHKEDNDEQIFKEEKKKRREIIEDKKEEVVEEKIEENNIQEDVVLEEEQKELVKEKEQHSHILPVPHIISVKEEHTPTIDEKMEEIKRSIVDTPSENVDTKMKEIKERFTVPYKFGRTTEAVKNDFIKFINELYKDAIKIDNFWLLRKPEEAAALASIQKNNFDTFYEYLKTNSINGHKMLEERNGETLTTLDKKVLINFISEEIISE